MGGGGVRGGRGWKYTCICVFISLRTYLYLKHDSPKKYSCFKVYIQIFWLCGIAVFHQNDY